MVILQKRHHIWMKWLQREWFFRISTLQIPSVHHVCYIDVVVSLLIYIIILARAAMLSGRLPIRNGFYTTNAHARNGM